MSRSSAKRQSEKVFEPDDGSEELNGTMEHEQPVGKASRSSSEVGRPSRERRSTQDEPTAKDNAPSDEASAGNDEKKSSQDGAGLAADNSPVAKQKKRRILIIVGIVVVLAGVGALIWWLNARNFESTDDAYVEGHVVSVSPQVSARVRKVLVEDNQVVKAGDLLAELDPTDYEVALAQAKAMEASARAKLEQAKTQVTAAAAGKQEAEAGLQVAEVNFQNTDQDLKRWSALEERARSKQQFDNAVSAQKTAAAQVAQGKAKLATAASQIMTADAAVAAAEGDLAKAAADVHRAEVNLGYTKVYAPQAGRVTRKSVEAGAYVTPAQALLAVVPVEVWVIANYKETQLDLMRVGQPVTVSVDAFGGTDFTGKVQSIQAGTGARFSVLPAENATGNFVKVVQRVPVKILLDNPQISDGRFLSPGMSVEAKVRVR